VDGKFEFMVDVTLVKGRYAWIIDVSTDDEDKSVGVIGPSDAPDHLIERLRAGEGRRWQLASDDEGSGDHIDYEGRIITVDRKGNDTERTDLDFGPLDDYGCPNIGSTTIRYMNEKGEWVE
jgi:hypothetical protein